MMNLQIFIPLKHLGDLNKYLNKYNKNIKYRKTQGGDAIVISSSELNTCCKLNLQL